MYHVLGDRQKQEAVRTARQGPHCDRLMQSPTACLGCRENPFREEQRPSQLLDLERERRRARQLVLRERRACRVRPGLLALIRGRRGGLDLHDRAELGVLESSELSAEELLLLQVTHRKLREVEQQNLANRLGRAVQEGLAAMFGVKRRRPPEAKQARR